MLKKIFVNIMIIIMISSLSVYATEVSQATVSTDTVQGENGESTPKDENTSTDKKEEDNSNTNTNTSGNSTSTDTNSSNKTSSNKTTTNNKGQSKPKKDTDITTVQKSKDANLKELKVDAEGMTPEFNKDVTEYYLTVDLSVEEIKVTAMPVSDKAKVTIVGNKNLKEGKNTVTITVKAEDGTIKKYTLSITKVDDVEKANAELKSLEIENYDLYPRFKSNIYNYNLNIGENIQELKIIAEAEKENAKVEIEGNSNLKDGENIIKINVTAEDGETTRTYKINTYISSEKVEIKKESKLPAIILLIITGSAIVILGTFLIWKRIR